MQDVISQALHMRLMVAEAVLWSAAKNVLALGGSSAPLSSLSNVNSTPCDVFSCFLNFGVLYTSIFFTIAFKW